jgi:hypothetical protein
LDVRFGGLHDEDLTLIVHEALNAMGDGEAAVGACVKGQADQTLTELQPWLLP